MVNVSTSVVLTLLLFAGTAGAQALYKYQDANGDWVYTDRAPDEGQAAEVSDLPTGTKTATVRLTDSVRGRAFHLEAHNEFAIPVEVVVALDELINLESPGPEQLMRWVVPARSSRTLLELSTVADNESSSAEYRFTWILGDPNANHRNGERYRVPFSVSSSYLVTQAFPSAATHQAPESYYAVDLAMPIGTDVYAARGGIVFEVASTNFRGGVDAEEYMDAANIVRILHDDGSHALYAHLNWNSIRVGPGDRVARGEYIADSGNTGFSSGPHLHFAVLVNRGLRTESVPIVFEGPDSNAVVPETGMQLVAY